MSASSRLLARVTAGPGTCANDVTDSTGNNYAVHISCFLLSTFVCISIYCRFWTLCVGSCVPLITRVEISQALKQLGVAGKSMVETDINARQVKHYVSLYC